MSLPTTNQLLQPYNRTIEVFSRQSLRYKATIWVCPAWRHLVYRCSRLVQRYRQNSLCRNYGETQHTEPTVTKTHIGQTDGTETQNQMCRRLLESRLYLWFVFPDTEVISCQASRQQASLLLLLRINSCVLAHERRADHLQ